MCGLAGFVGAGDQADLMAMTRALSHRGPDGEGYYTDQANALNLGHRRLAVVDIKGGAQPMWNAARTVCIIFNGEIYNHKKLREELESAGRKFVTDHSDTEVLLQGYLHWGRRLPEILDGMFAFAIWDVAARQLFFARDRFGEKPLHWYQNGEVFAFASELSALFRHRRVSAEIGGPGLRKYFAYGYVPSPHTPFEGVYKLPPGSRATFNLRERTLKVDRYWRYELNPEKASASDDQLDEEFLSLLDRAVADRMTADVPVGYFLSGGVDSSAILASAVRAAEARSLRAFTIGFSEHEYDESEQAARVARHLGVTSHIDQMNLGDVGDIAPSLLERFAEPIADPSILPTYLVSRAARRGVTVALSGDGGDELFAGYQPFAALAPARAFGTMVPAVFRDRIAAVVGGLRSGESRLGFVEKIQRGLRGACHRPGCWIPLWMAPVPVSSFESLFGRPASVEDLYDEAIATWDSASGLTDVERAMEFFGNFYLPECVLAKVDRASMATALEVRAPFLSNAVVDFSRKLTVDQKYKLGRRKIILKRATKRRLPIGTTSQPKRGFGIPLAKWLRQSNWLEHLAPLRGIDFEWVSARARAHAAGTTDERLLLWSYLNLQACVHAALK